jgi:DNA-binding transcriptional ArsR family regulator
MSKPFTKPRPAEALHRHYAGIFGALGDETRLALLERLSIGEARPIVRLTEATQLTRQAVTKHLRVLEKAGVVRSQRRGREQLYVLEPAPLAAARQLLDRFGAQWEARLAGLQQRLESETA